MQLLQAPVNIADRWYTSIIVLYSVQKWWVFGLLDIHV